MRDIVIHYSPQLTLQSLCVVCLFSSVQLLSRVRLFASLWTAAHQASLSITNLQSLLKLMSIESVRPSNHLILCRPLLLPPLIFLSIRVFSNESALYIRSKGSWEILSSQAASLGSLPECQKPMGMLQGGTGRSRVFGVSSAERGFLSSVPL